jgi:hypothetical protein
LRDAFVKRDSHYDAVLREAASKSWPMVSALRSSRFPRLWFQVLDDTESAAPDVQSLTLER